MSTPPTLCTGAWSTLSFFSVLDLIWSNFLIVTKPQLLITSPTPSYHTTKPPRYVFGLDRCVCSRFSTTVVYCTSGTVPSQPDPPMLSECCVKALTISWVRRPCDDSFTLHMEDESTVCPSVGRL